MILNTLKLIREAPPDKIVERTGKTIVLICENCHEESTMEHVVLERIYEGENPIRMQCYECSLCHWLHDKALRDILIEARKEYDF